MYDDISLDGCLNKLIDDAGQGTCKLVINDLILLLFCLLKTLSPSLQIHLQREWKILIKEMESGLFFIKLD